MRCQRTSETSFNKPQQFKQVNVPADELYILARIIARLHIARHRGNAEERVDSGMPEAESTEHKKTETIGSLSVTGDNKPRCEVTQSTEQSDHDNVGTTVSEEFDE